MADTLTSIRVPVPVRDLVRDEAAKHNQSQAQLIEHAVRELQHQEFIRAAQAQVPDEDYLREMREWDNADLAPSLQDYPA